MPGRPSSHWLPWSHASYASLTLNQLTAGSCEPETYPVSAGGPPNTRIKANTAPSAMRAKIIKPTLPSSMLRHCWCRQVMPLHLGQCCLLGLGSRTSHRVCLVLPRTVCCPAGAFVICRLDRLEGLSLLMME